MNYKNVLDYYNSFSESNHKDINNYAIILSGVGKNEYINWIEKNENELYYLVDSENENYIIGYGKIINYVIPDYYKDSFNTGNIGYGVRPNERNKGYGTKILELILLKCKENGMDEVYISCNKNNNSSQKIILKNNGKLEKEFLDEYEGHGLKYIVEIKK